MLMIMISDTDTITATIITIIVTGKLTLIPLPSLMHSLLSFKCLVL